MKERMKHILKIEPPFFQAVVDGLKTFEIRKDDRGFQAGDDLTLREFDPAYKGYHRSEADMYTGRYHEAKIGYVTAYEQKSGYVVFSVLSNV
jgi:hypothetical protein